MVNTEGLRTYLEQFGTIVFCGLNNPKSYVVVVSEWTSDISTFEYLMQMFVVETYPKQFNISLNSGVIKAEYNK